MARELLILWLGRRRRDPFEALCGDYRARLERFGPVRDRVLKAGTERDDRDRLEREGESILAALPTPCRLVALDRRGRSLDSKQVSKTLDRWEEEWPHGLAFVLGSDIGLAESVLSKAHLRWSLSALTLPHALARVVLYEQLYRARAMRSGLPYHRESLEGAR